MEVQKVYIVMGSDSPCYGHESWVCKVFTDKAMAEKYCEVHNELEEMYNFYCWTCIYGRYGFTHFNC